MEENDLYECENDCGFKGTYSEVEKHELTCKFKKKLKLKFLNQLNAKIVKKIKRKKQPLNYLRKK